MGIYLSLRLFFSLSSFYHTATYSRLLFESLLLLDEPFYRTRERLQKLLLRVLSE
jgi:hypothetical protein